jgi:hypothetical protein
MNLTPSGSVPTRRVKLLSSSFFVFIFLRNLYTRQIELLPRSFAIHAGSSHSALVAGRVPASDFRTELHVLI